MTKKESNKKLTLKALLEKKETKEEVSKRLLENGYMVLNKKCSGFVCKECTWSSNGFCNHKKIQTDINPQSGCCNHFFPENGDVKFGEQK